MAVPLEDGHAPSLGSPIGQLAPYRTSVTQGLPLGTSRSGATLSIDLLRPRPTRFVVTGDGWLGSLLALRAAVLGARIVVLTDRPARWQQLVAAVGGRTPFASVLQLDAPAPSVPTAAEPLVVLHDSAVGAGDLLAARAAWHTSIHLLPRADAQHAGLLEAADLVLLRSPAAAEVPELLELLRLPPAVGGQLGRLGPTEYLGITRGAAQLVTVTPTEPEIALIGAAETPAD